MTHFNCIKPGAFLLPNKDVNLSTWACIACDQYTSTPNYWADVKKLVGSNPSTYQLIIPECDLENTATLAPRIHQNMKNYLENGILEETPTSYILVERNTSSGMRLGLVCLLDLDQYDFSKGSQSPVRATEETISARIPPRMAVREHAPMELGHVLLLIDDPKKTVIEPLHALCKERKACYDFPLMKNGGHLKGYLINKSEDFKAIDDALFALANQPKSKNEPLFAVGDGNHSLATAKTCWETIASNLNSEERKNHPARYAMVELMNLHDDALCFEPIHRVLYGVEGDMIIDEIKAYAKENGIELKENSGDIVCIFGDKDFRFNLTSEGDSLSVEGLQRFLDGFILAHPTCTLDYVHGDDTLVLLATLEKTVGFLLPGMEKATLFPTVANKGSLPRKTFSLGHADDKRFYMECRLLR